MVYRPIQRLCSIDLQRRLRVLRPPKERIPHRVSSAGRAIQSFLRVEPDARLMQYAGRRVIDVQKDGIVFFSGFSGRNYSRRLARWKSRPESTGTADRQSRFRLGGPLRSGAIRSRGEVFDDHERAHARSSRPPLRCSPTRARQPRRRGHLLQGSESQFGKDAPLHETD